YQFNLLRDYLGRGHAFRFLRELHAIANREERSSLSVLGGAMAARIRKRKPYAFLSSDYGQRDANSRALLLHAIRDTGPQSSRVGQRLFRDVKWGNVKLVLGYTDRVSMASSIEARVPFLDLS